MLNMCPQLAFIAPGGFEFLIVMLVLLLMFGAKDAPRIFRKINEMINSVRNTADSFKREIMYSDIDDDSPASYSPDDGTSHEDDDCDYGSEYEDECHDEDYDYLNEDQERDYSDETFQNLEKDLEKAGAEKIEDVPTEEEPKAEEEDDNARKA